MDGASDDIPISESAAAAEVARLVDDARTLWERHALVDSELPLRGALELAEGALGTDHPLVAVVLSHRGWLAVARGRHDEAVSEYRRALAIREARLGPSHLDTLHAAEELAAVLFQADARNEEADALALRAIAAYEAAGRDDAELAELIAIVAWRRYWIGRYSDAEPMFLRALATRERFLGPGDPATADTAKRLAIMYDHRGFDVDPEPYYRKALAGFEEAHADDHADVIEARYRLADYLLRQGREDEAAPLFDRVIVTLSASAAVLDPGKVHWMLGDCCEYLRRAGREEEAEAIEEWAGSSSPLLSMNRAQAQHAEEAFGADSLELAEALDHLAGTYATAGRADEAEETARRALAIHEARLGADHPVTVEATKRLANIRDFAASFAANQPRRRLRRSGGELFDAFTSPWRDERRPDLIRAYLTAMAEHVEDDPTGAVQAITALTFSADLDEQWSVILELIAESPDDDWVLQTIAAGPLEGFLGRFDGEAIERVEDEAERDPRFRRVLSGVWKHRMSDSVWERVRAIQATVLDPLPEMRPFTTGEPT